jgi:hypothetical protein
MCGGRPRVGRLRWNALSAVSALLSNRSHTENSTRCRQGCRQEPFIYTRAGAGAKANRLNSGAGRGSRTPEDISRLIYSQMRLTTSLSQPILFMEPPVGFEPTTYTLQKCCSTVELRRPIILTIKPPAKYSSSSFSLCLCSNF